MLGGGPWKVSNAGDSESGNFNLKTGTWHSVNTFYAQLEKRVGVCNSVKMAEKFGMKRADGNALTPIPSQVLGVNDIDMVHLAAAYAGFAARGKYCAPMSVIEVVDAEGKKLKSPKQDCRQVLDEDVADKVNEILQGVLTQGTAKGRAIGRPAAAKTGTCEAHTCAVFAGHTPNLAAATAYWDFRSPWKYPVYNVYGADTPGAMWQQSMRSALAGEPAPGFARTTRDFGDTIRVPDVKGMSVAAATDRLKAAELQVRLSPRPVQSDAPRGSVASTSPDAQTEVGPGSTVILYISNGRGRGNGPGDFEWPWEN
jgi:membrane peptidoglycan carboxypeptidase